MSTIRNLGSKYCGIITDFVVKCDVEGKSIESELENNLLMKELITKLTKGEILSEELVTFSRSKIVKKENKKKIDEEFRECINRGVLEDVKSLFSSRSSIDLTEWFVFMCTSGNLSMAKWALDRCPEIDLRTDKEEAFRFSCEYGHLEVAKWLLEIEPDINVRACNDHAFDGACERGHIEVAKWILGLRPDIRIDENKFASMCYEGQLEVAKWFLELKPDLNLRDDNDFAFRYACLKGQLEIAKWLLSVRSDIDVRAEYDYAFRWACWNNHLEVAKWLLETRPEIDIKGNIDIIRKRFSQNNREVIEWLDDLSKK